MKKILGITVALVCLTGIVSQAQAAPKAAKVNKAIKERLVLMALRVPDEDKSLAGSMEIALVEGLQEKYEVFSGEQVAQKARAIFLKESKNTSKKDCDETRCMQDIAEAFQAELIATANVTKRPDGYFLALNVQNIFDNKVVYSKSMPCKNCDAYEVVEKLKELSGASSTNNVMVSPAPVPANGNSKYAADVALWAEAQKGNSVDDYQVYLTQFPNGQYVALAKSRIKKLQDQSKLDLDIQDQKAWNKAEGAATLEGYLDYLLDFPKGNYVEQAKINYIQIEAGPGRYLGDPSFILARDVSESATGKSKKSECVFPNSEIEAPLWVCDGPVTGIEVSAVASTYKSELGAAFMKKKAAESARLQIAQQTRLHVVNALKRSMESQGQRIDPEVMDRIMTSVSKSVANPIADQILQSSKISRATIGPDGTMYVLVGLDEASAHKLTESAIKLSMSNDPALWQQLRAKN